MCEPLNGLALQGANEYGSVTTNFDGDSLVCDHIAHELPEENYGRYVIPNRLGATCWFSATLFCVLHMLSPSIEPDHCPEFQSNCPGAYVGALEKNKLAKRQQ